MIPLPTAKAVLHRLQNPNKAPNPDLLSQLRVGRRTGYKNLVTTKNTNYDSLLTRVIQTVNDTVDDLLEMRQGTIAAYNYFFTGTYNPPKNAMETAGYYLGLPVATVTSIMSGEILVAGGLEVARGVSGILKHGIWSSSGSNVGSWIAQIGSLGKKGINELRPGIYELDPKNIRFTQSDASPYFNNGKSVNTLISDLQAGLVTPSDLPPIQVVSRNGKLFSLEQKADHLKAVKRNTRIIVFSSKCFVTKY